MYKPAPPRPKKTNISRTRTGCLGCRAGRVKCDEKKPVCGRCSRLGQDCAQQTSFKFCTVYERTAEKSANKLESAQHAAGLRHEEAKDLFQEQRHVRSESSAIGCLDVLPRPGQLVVAPTTSHIPQSLTLNGTPTDAIRFYSSAWDWTRIRPVASLLQNGDVFSLGTSPTFAEMMTALSASHLSRTSPQRRLLMPSSAPEQSFKPNTAHENVSQEFYGSVMKRVVRWSERDFGSSPILGLTVLTLFCLLESSMGSFQAFDTHFDGATQLIENYAANILAHDRHASSLLGPLVEVSLQMWWRRVYFGTPEFHRNRPKISFNLGFQSSMDFEARRASILLILCESHRIHNAAIIAHWDRYHDAAVNGGSQLQHIEHFRKSTDIFTQQIKNEQQLLEAWGRRYDLSGSIENVDAPQRFDSAALDVRPLHMTSHPVAMDLSYYIASKVLQSYGPLDSLSMGAPEEMRNAYCDVEAWIHLLLRVVAGLNWKECVRLNTYTIGITGVLLSCLLRSHDVRIGLWCEEWLQGCLDGTSFEEGSFPAFQTLKIIRLVNKERSQGRDVFGLFQTVEDGGGSGKFGSYQSQTLSSLVVYGRCRKTGRLQSYYISI